MATKTDAEGLVALPYGELPDGEHLDQLLSLIGDAHESLSDTSSAILYRTNGKTEGEVTFELIGRLADFAQNARFYASSLLSSIDEIEGSFDDLATLARGDEIDMPRFDEHGNEQHNSRVLWHYDVARALGVADSGSWKFAQVKS